MAGEKPYLNELIIQISWQIFTCLPHKQSLRNILLTSILPNHW